MTPDETPRCGHCSNNPYGPSTAHCTRCGRNAPPTPGEVLALFIARYDIWAY